MRPFALVAAGAAGGALLAVALVLVMARHGLIPINDAQMQGYLLRHADILPAMLNRAQAMDEQRQQAEQAAAMRKLGQAAFFDPAIAFVTGPADAKNTLVEFYDYD
jgi:protein-disulfide isomerase